MIKTDPRYKEIKNERQHFIPRKKYGAKNESDNNIFKVAKCKHNISFDWDSEHLEITNNPNINDKKFTDAVFMKDFLKQMN